MSTFIVGFICAIILAIVLIVWLAYYMFCRERHKPEHFQYSIEDLRIRNIEIAQDQDEGVKKQVTAGIFLMPSRHHIDNDYISRPDYPESPAPQLQPKTEKLIDILNDGPVDADVHKNVSFDLSSQCHTSDV
ncbi:PREDICTED: uncharacterized protein LOC106114050 [Papilio xuthus]|uniref:Uncharacterized protein LOC106114050 n=1 Tax=Papilio xuthus TaxID=66420 RepID=A0A194QK66_PAPXU|nr:PREDICTED: uncharacterized protein LOC106114050 [Papilio xuthus]KPJ05769.1 hypothetical protein RR46_02291 [Papilio xuthus]